MIIKSTTSLCRLRHPLKRDGRTNALSHVTSYFRDIIGRFSLLAGYDWDEDKKAKKEGICCLLSTESQVALARCMYVP